MTELTKAERLALATAAHDGDAKGSGCSCGAVFTATESIVTERTDELRCQLAASEIRLRAARSALAACADVREAKKSEPAVWWRYK